MAPISGTTRAITRIAPAILAVAMALTLAASPAPADELSDVQAELGSKAAELNALVQQLNEAQQAASEADGKITSLLAEIDGRQAARAGLQERISSLSKVMYKDGDGLNFFEIVVDSDSLSEMLDRMELRNKVLTEYAELSEEQQRSQQELEVAYREVSSEKDSQEALLAELKDRKAELDAAVAELGAREAQLNAAEQAALAEAAAASHQVAETFETVFDPVAAATAAAGGGTPASAEPEAAPAQAPAAEAAAPASAPVEAPAAQEPASSSAASGWQTGLASAYGGSSDPSTPNPGTTATGAVCDDWSVGVAVPLAWGPQAYYGRKVEISYGGRSIVATVNDCGGMGGGSRALDLQPGVFKALGASTCNEWGVREVQYRFL